MSELREELLGSTINKKRIIGVALVAILLITMFGFSVVLTSLLFGTQRPFPSKEKANTEYEDAELIAPPFPLDFFTELLKYLSPEQLAELADDIDPQDLADMIENMLDGDVDDLDLSQFSEALLPLLLGPAGLIEKFRIYDYDSVNDMADALWRYECFDVYTGDQWTSTANALPFNFISLGEYWSQYSSQDLVRIKMPLTPNVGQNSLGIPILFPTPFIYEENINAPNLVPDSESLTVDDFNSTALNLEFTSADSVNLTFELFGSDLPSEQDINNSAVLVSAPPTAEYINIINQFTQLPPDFNSYYSSQPNFQTHYDILDSIIDNSTDNGIVIANKIRNYLQSQFTFPESADEYESAPEGRDTVDWFLEQGTGVFSDFVSAFCVFSRAFGVASRFVDGFRTPNFFGQIEEIDDQSEGKKAIIIRYNNIFNWAEIYVPTEIDGDGMWVQFDVNSGGGGVPIPSSFNITVNSNFTAGNRGTAANLTAILTSSTNQSVESREIIFIDTTYGVVIGNASTDLNGTASILLDINSSQIVGPHVIVAQYGSAVNWTQYTVYGDIEVNLTSVNPTMINRSISNTTRIQGYVNDPIANQRVKNATVEFVLLDRGTNNKIGFPFDTNFINADVNGDFDEFINVNPWVSKGNYEIRVDFNGSWDGLPLAFGIMNDSSNRIDFNITEEAVYSLLFYINDFEAYNYESPTVTRYSTLELKAVLMNETGDPVQGEVVEFYDYSRSIFIGSNTTNVNGITTFDYYIDSSAAGPNLLYSKYETSQNFSYFILDAPISINLNIWPLNREVSKGTTNRTFYIQGYLNDTDNSQPIKYGEISIHMFDGATEVYNWILESGSFQSNEYGEIYAEFSVDSLTVTKNYTLQVWFNGTFIYPPPIPYFFNLFAYSNFSSYANADYQLKVYDPAEVIIIFTIEGSHRSLSYNDGNPPATYNLGEFANFEVWINQSGSYAPNTSIVRLRDLYTNDILGTYTYDGTELLGYHQFLINTSSPTLHAGLHYIEVEYEYASIVYPYNSTYIIINETVSVSGISNDYVILRDNDMFTISGTVSNIGEDLRGLEVEIMLLDGSLNDVSYNLNLFDPKSKYINDNGDYSFSSVIFLSCPQGEYYISINITGRMTHTDGPLSITLSNPYMVSSNSSLIPLDITAGIIIIQGDFHTIPHDINDGLWWVGDTLFIYGNLTWDNNTVMANMKVNVTVQMLNGELVVFNEVVTDSWGGFNASFLIDEAWSELNYVYETKIIIYFDTVANNLQYVEDNELEFI